MPVTSRFTSGFCGVILVRDDKGVYVRRTWGEQSHLRCPGSVGNHECQCNCHFGETPWEYNGEWTGHRPVVLEPRLVDDPIQPRFTPVKRSRVVKPAKAPTADAVTQMPTESMTTAVSQMTEALMSMEDLSDGGIPEALRDTESGDDDNEG